MIQSILFEKEKKSISSVKKWITEHGYIYNDKASNYYRVHQVDPKKLEVKGYKFNMKLIDKKRNIYLVLAYK